MLSSVAALAAVAALAEVAFSRYAQAALHADAWMGLRNSGTAEWQGEW